MSEIEIELEWMEDFALFHCLLRLRTFPALLYGYPFLSPKKAHDRLVNYLLHYLVTV